jgi:hypothetical protein
LKLADTKLKIAQAELATEESKNKRIETEFRADQYRQMRAGNYELTDYFQKERAL